MENGKTEAVVNDLTIDEAINEDPAALPCNGKKSRANKCIQAKFSIPTSIKETSIGISEAKETPLEAPQDLEEMSTELVEKGLFGSKKSKAGNDPGERTKTSALVNGAYVEDLDIETMYDTDNGLEAKDMDQDSKGSMGQVILNYVIEEKDIKAPMDAECRCS